jgi:hypothetical protein
MVSGYAAGPDDPGEPVSLIQVRALMVPPGIPDFLTRVRLVRAGPVTLTGRAWAGRKSVAQVEVSTDGGETWGTAQLGTPLSAYAWTPWSSQWQAAPGGFQLCARHQAVGSQRWRTMDFGAME